MQSASETRSQASRYVTPVVVHEGLAFVSGQLPRRAGQLVCCGRVGAEVDVEAARDAARISASACVSLLEAAVGGRQNIVRILKVTGFVASAPGFNGQPAVIDAASETILALLGEAGLHARSAVGVAELPHGAPVEIELIAAVRTGAATAAR